MGHTTMDDWVAMSGLGDAAQDAMINAPFVAGKQAGIAAATAAGRGPSVSIPKAPSQYDTTSSGRAGSTGSSGMDVSSLLTALTSVAAPVTAAVLQERAQRQDRRTARRAANAPVVPVPVPPPGAGWSVPGWLKVLAGVVVLGGAGYGVYRYAFSGSKGKKNRKRR